MHKLPRVRIIRVCMVLLCIVLMVCIGSCNSRELTRSRAAKLIESSDDFQRPAAIIISPDYRQSLTLIGAGSQTATKTEFALSRFLQSHPELATLRHLGLIEMNVKNIEYPDSASSPVTITTFLTDEGRAASRQWQQSGRGWAVPIAKRELVEVTGLTGGESGSKQSRVEYTWRWRPTDVGENFDTSSQAHQSLPVSIRDSFGATSFTGVLRNVGQVVLFDSSQTQKATAKLQLYDDGWRVAQAGT